MPPGEPPREAAAWSADAPLVAAAAAVAAVRSEAARSETAPVAAGVVIPFSCRMMVVTLAPAGAEGDGGGRRVEAEVTGTLTVASVPWGGGRAEGAAAPPPSPPPPPPPPPPVQPPAAAAAAGPPVAEEHGRCCVIG